MDTSHIATLLDPFLLYPLTPARLDEISTYIDLLLRWNARTNLTAIRTPDEIITRHFGESLFAAQTLFPTACVGAGALVCPAERSSADAGHDSGLKRTETLKSLVIPTEGRNLLFDGSTPTASPLEPLDLIDLGSGAGFPGIPIHLWVPNLRTTLIESQQKKVAFLREVIRALTLMAINVSPARAEDFSSTARLVTLRAVERFDHILPTAARLVAPQGRLALLIAEPQLARARSTLHQFAWQDPVSFPHSASRLLLLGTCCERSPQGA